jgi:hypothetical protein
MTLARNLLDRIPANHPQAKTLRAAAEGTIAVAESFAAKKAALQKGNRYTSEGMQQALREMLPDHAAQMAAAKAPITKLQREAKQRREAIKVPTPDPANLAAAIERQEIRSFLRGLPIGERNALLVGTKDERILEAALTAPPELSGLSGEKMRHIAERVETNYLEMKFGTEVKAVAALEDAVAEAAAAAKVARARLAIEADMDERAFAALVGPAEQKGAAPWLVKNGAGDVPQVVEVDDNGTAHYHRATEWEASVGVYYKDVDEWCAAIGEAA